MAENINEQSLQGINPTRKKVYNRIQQLGQLNVGTEQDFDKLFDDDNNVTKIYNYLRNNDSDVDYEDEDKFRNRVCAPRKSQQTSQPQQTQSNATTQATTATQQTEQPMYVDERTGKQYTQAEYDAAMADYEKQKDKHEANIAKYGEGYVTLTDGSVMSKADYDKQKAAYDAQQKAYEDTMAKMTPTDKKAMGMYNMVTKTKQNAGNIMDIPQEYIDFCRKKWGGKGSNQALLNAWWNEKESTRAGYVERGINDTYANGEVPVPYKREDFSSRMWKQMFADQKRNAEQLANMRKAKVDESGNAYIETPAFKKVDGKEVYNPTNREYLDRVGNAYETAAEAKGMDAAWAELERQRAEQQEAFVNSLPSQVDALMQEIYYADPNVGSIGVPVFQGAAITTDDIGASPERIAFDFLKKMKQLIGNSKDNAGLMKGLTDAVTDKGIMDFGMLDVRNAFAVKEIKDKLDKGEKLTKGEDTLLKVLALKSAVEENFKTSGWYTAGQVTGEMIPFMLQMAANPYSGIAKGAGKGVTKAIFKKLGNAAAGATERAVIKSAMKSATKRLTGKAIGAIVDNTISSVGLATSLQAGSLVAGTVERMNGNVGFSYDNNGNVQFGQFEDGVGLMEALGKSLVNLSVENFSEGVGEWFAPVFKACGLGKLTSFLTGAGNTNRNLAERFFNTLGTSGNKFFEATKYNGILGEYAEEKVGDIMHHYLEAWNSNDTNSEEYQKFWDNYFDTGENAQLMLSVGVLGAFMGTASLGAHGLNMRTSKKNIARLSDNASLVFSGEGNVEAANWNAVKNEIDNCSNEDFAAMMQRIIDAPETNRVDRERKIAAVKYAQAVFNHRVMSICNAADVAMQSKLPHFNEKMQLQQAEAEAQEAETPEAKQKLYARHEAAKARAEAAQAAAIAQMGDAVSDDTSVDEWIALFGETPADQMANIRQDESLTDEQKSALTAYIYTSTQSNALEAVTQAKAEEAAQKAAESVDAITHAESNTIITADVVADAHKGKRVNVLTGDINNPDAMLGCIDDDGNYIQVKAHNVNMLDGGIVDATEERERAMRDARQSSLIFEEEQNRPTRRVSAAEAPMQQGEKVVVTIYGADYVGVIEGVNNDGTYNVRVGEQTITANPDAVFNAASVQAEAQQKAEAEKSLADMDAQHEEEAAEDATEEQQEKNDKYADIKAELSQIKTNKELEKWQKNHLPLLMNSDVVELVSERYYELNPEARQKTTEQVSNENVQDNQDAFSDIKAELSKIKSVKELEKWQKRNRSLLGIREVADLVDEKYYELSQESRPKATEEQLHQQKIDTAFADIKAELSKITTIKELEKWQKNHLPLLLIRDVVDAVSERSEQIKQQSSTTPSQGLIAVDEDGNPMYEDAGVDATVADLNTKGGHDYAKEMLNNSNAVSSEAKRQLKELEDNAPERKEMESPTSRSYRTRVAEWQAQVDEAKAIADKANATASFWREVEKRLANATQGASVQEKLASEAEVSNSVGDKIETDEAILERYVESAKGLQLNEGETTDSLAKELGVSKRKLKMFAAIAKALGVRVRFSNYLVHENGKFMVNALNDKGEREVVISKYSIANGKGLFQLLGHEFTHQLRKDTGADIDKFILFARSVIGKKEWDNEFYSKLPSYYDQFHDEAVRLGLKSEADINAYIADKVDEEIAADYAGRLMEKGQMLEMTIEGMKAKGLVFEKSWLDKLAYIINKIMQYFVNDEVDAEVDTDSELVQDAMLQLVEAYNNSMSGARNTRNFAMTPQELVRLRMEQRAESLAQVAMYKTFMAETERMMSGESGVTFNKKGEVTAEKTDGEPTRYSVRTWEEGGRNQLAAYLAKQVTEGKFREEEAKNLLASMDELARGAKDIADGNPSSLFGQWSVEMVRMKDGTEEPLLHAKKNNDEYDLNIDFSTVCKKRQVMDNIFNEMIKRGMLENDSLSPTDVARINQIIQKHGLEIACGICFVDSRRYNAWTFANNFLDKYNPIVQSLMPSAELAGYNYSENAEFSNEGKVDLTQNKEVVDFGVLFADGKYAKLGVDGELNLKYNDEGVPVGSLKSLMRGRGAYSLDLEYIARLFCSKREDSKGKPKPSVLAQAIKDYRSGKTIGSGNKKRLKTFDECIKSACSSAKERMAYAIATDPRLRKLAKAEDFVASLGWTNVMQKNSELEKLWNIQKGSAGARANEGNTQYDSDVILAANEVKGDIYDIGGYRMQSFSDFIGRMYFDYLQSFADLAALKVPAHAYTKEPSFVKLFGLMNMKINMSLICKVDPNMERDEAGLTRDADGNYMYYYHSTVRDEQGNILIQGQTFPPEEAFRLQDMNRYTKNVGTIVVGLSRQHILMMLRDPNIRMVIPYHASGLPHGVAVIYNLKEINDYQDYQNTREPFVDKKTGKTKYRSITKEQKAWVDQFNFILHQLTIAEDRSAAYNALNIMFVKNYAKDLTQDNSEGVHEVYERLYNAIRNGELTEGVEAIELSEQREDRNFIPTIAADIYRNGCTANGLVPKFDEFQEEHDYYKVLIDFAVYDRDGHYTPQEDVKFQVPDNVGEYIAETLAEDEQITEDMESNMESIIGKVEDYLGDTELRKRQDEINKKGSKAKEEENEWLGRDIFNVGDPRNIPSEKSYSVDEKKTLESLSAKEKRLIFVDATVAPFFDKTAFTSEDAEGLRNSREYGEYIERGVELAHKLALPVHDVFENRGGYYNTNTEQDIVEVSATWEFDARSLGDDDAKTRAEMFACMLGDLSPEQQEAVICYKYTDGYHGANGLTKSLGCKDVDRAVKTLKAIGVKDFTIDEKNKKVIISIFKDGNVSEDAISEIVELYNKVLIGLQQDGNYNGQSTETEGVNSTYLGAEARRGRYATWTSTFEEVPEGKRAAYWDDVRETIADASSRLEDFLSSPRRTNKRNVSPAIQAEGNERADGEVRIQQGASRSSSGESVLTRDFTERHDSGTQKFFSSVVKEEKYTEYKQKWQPWNGLTDGQEVALNAWIPFDGGFSTHINISIPYFREIQLTKIDALSKYLESGQKLIDLCGSQGDFSKAIAVLNNGIKADNVDINPDMKNEFDKQPVAGVEYVQESVMGRYDDDETNEHYDEYNPVEKGDVVHESMGFQFIMKDRKQFIDRIADSLLKPDGVVLLEEKIHPDTITEWAYNEAQKDQQFKAFYWNDAEVAKKKAEVLVGMGDDQADESTLVEDLKSRFKYVDRYWKSGNFVGYIASNNEGNFKRLRELIGDTTNEFSYTSITDEMRDSLEATIKGKKEGVSYSVDWSRNSGYTQREDGSRISVRAGSAEYDGKFSEGKFRVQYGVSRKAFDILKELGVIKSNEWHHTGASFKQTKFYEWNDDSDYTEGNVEDGSLAKKYADNKKQIESLIKEYEQKDWEYKRKKSVPEKRTYEDWVRFQNVGMYYLTEEEQKRREEEQNQISKNSNAPSSERYLMHRDVDAKYLEMSIQHAIDSPEMKQKYDEENAMYDKERAYNEEVDAYNESTNGKEKVIRSIAGLIYDDKDEADAASSRAIYSITYDIRSQKKAEEKKKALESIEKKKAAWLKKQYESGKATDIVRTTEKPEYFVETKQEMNGKYGWFDASYRYNLPIYYSGIQFADRRTFNKYRDFDSQKIDSLAEIDNRYAYSVDDDTSRREGESVYDYGMRMAQRNEGSKAKSKAEAEDTKYNDVSYSIVEDTDEIERLNNEPYTILYHAMQKITMPDGKTYLFPPMAAIQDGKYVQGIPINDDGKITPTWEKADENPHLAFRMQSGDGGKKVPEDAELEYRDGVPYYQGRKLKGDFNENGEFVPSYYFALKKGNTGDSGKKLGDLEAVLYDPYQHSGFTPVNDQFTTAYDRSHMVIVKVRVPNSELLSNELGRNTIGEDGEGSGYKADRAGLGVGVHPWTGGKLKTKKRRVVGLSRWDMPLEIMSDEEVAREWKKTLDDNGLKEVPFNIVTPSQREALINLGVKIGKPTNDNGGKASIPAYNAWKSGSDVSYSVSEPTLPIDENYWYNDLRSISEANVADILYRWYRDSGLASAPMERRQILQNSNGISGANIKPFYEDLYEFQVKPYIENYRDGLETMLADKRTTDAAKAVIQKNLADANESIDFYERAASGDISAHTDFDEVRYSVDQITSADPFVSNAARGVASIQQNKASGEQWLNMLRNKGFLKDEEDKWIGLSDFLKDKKSVTKQEVLEYIAENAIKVEDVKYGDLNREDIEPILSEYNSELKEFAEQHDDEDFYERHYNAFEDMCDKYGDDFENAFQVNGDSLEPTTYFDGSLTGQAKHYLRIPDKNTPNKTRLEYTTEGLTNKREIALVVPSIDSWKEDDEIHFGDAGEGRAVAWTRFGDATSTDGKRVLVIDEVQSKRHQEGRDVGYDRKDKKLQEEWNEILVDYRTSQYLYQQFLKGFGGFSIDVSNMSEYDKERYEYLKSEYKKNDERRKNFLNAHREFNSAYKTIRVPDAPFRKNWHEVAMKRMLRLAAEEGYDAVAWTTGAQQAERYDLSKQVDSIVYKKNEDGTYRLSAIVGSKGNPIGDKISAEKLYDYVGKELADKILKEEGTKTEVSSNGSREYWNELSGVDLMVGGEGMRGFYDKMIPSFMDKYCKKWGTKTHDIQLLGVEPSARTMHAVDVTPEMKESVMQGQVMYSVSEEEDAAYMDAVKRGDMKTAERMVADAAVKAGYRVNAYHGTTNVFTKFDKSKGNAENNFGGGGFYFTNNEADVENNYANNDGADLTNKVELLAERLEYEEGYEDMSYDDRLEEARKRISEGEPNVINAALKMDNPVVIGGADQTFFDCEYEYDEENDEYGEQEGMLVDFYEALNDVVSENEWNRIDLYPILEYGDGGLTAQQLETKAREILDIGGYEDYEGNMATGEAIREAFERMGFDGIVDNTVSFKFKGMHLDRGTTHFIVFNPNQIKSTEVTYDDNGNVIPLSQRFKESNEDIRYSVDDTQSIDNDPMPVKPKREGMEGHIEYMGRVEQYNKELVAWLSRHPSKVETDEQARKVLIHRIDQMLTKGGMDEANKKTLTKMLNTLKDTRKRNIAGKMEEIKDIVNYLEMKAMRKKVDELLNMKVQKVNGVGQSVARLVDDKTRKMFERIRENMIASRISDFDDEIHDLRSENWYIRSDAEGRSLTPDEQQRINDNNARIRELQASQAAQLKGNIVGDREAVDRAYNNLVSTMSDPAYISNEEDDIMLAQLAVLRPIFDGEQYIRDIASIRIGLRKIEELKERKKAGEDVTAELAAIKNEFGSDKASGMRKLIMAAQQSYLDAMDGVDKMLTDLLSEGRGKLQEEIQQERERRAVVVRESVHDVSGIKGSIDVQEGESNEKQNPTRLPFNGPLSSFEYMARRIATRTFGKDSWFYKHFITSPEGVVAANNRFNEGMRQSLRALNDKCKEIFGESVDEQWYKRNNRKANISILVDSDDESGQRYNMKLSEDTATYVWMLWQQADGQAKLKNMGFDAQSMAQIKDFIGDKNVRWAEWVQGTFLKQLRIPYNEAYKAINHTSLAEIENYFPIKTSKYARHRTIELDGNTGRGAGSLNVKTGSSVVRTCNVVAIDLNRGAFDVLLDHIDEVQDYIAYSKVRQELGWILSSNTFNLLVDKNNNGAFERLKKAAMVATRCENHDGEMADRVFNAISKGLVGGNIAYRTTTALKQMLSVPAYFGYSQDPRFWARLLFNIGMQYTRNAPAALETYITQMTNLLSGGNVNFDVIESADNGGSKWISNAMNWAMQNIPDYRSRVMEGVAGMEGVNLNDGKGIVSRAINGSLKNGMRANRLIDAITVAIGIKTIYDYKMERAKDALKRDLSTIGLTGDAADLYAKRYMQKAEEDAIMEATIYYNATQQSNNPAFLSPWQTSSSYIGKSFTLYKNSPTGYARKTAESLQDMRRVSRADTRRRMRESYVEDILRKRAEALADAAIIRGEESESNREELVAEYIDSAPDAVVSKAYTDANMYMFKQTRKAAFDALWYGLVMNHLWNIGGCGLLGFITGKGIETLLAGGGGGDDDAVEATEAIAYWLGVPFNGIAGADTISSIAKKVLGQGNVQDMVLNSVLGAEINKVVREITKTCEDFGGLSPQLGWYIFSKAGRFVGMSPDILTNTYLAVERMIRYGWKDGDERVIDLMLLLQSPESNRREVAKTLFKDRSEKDFMTAVCRASKYIYADEGAYEGFITGAKELTGKKEKELRDFWFKQNASAYDLLIEQGKKGVDKLIDETDDINELWNIYGEYNIPYVRKKVQSKVNRLQTTSKKERRTGADQIASDSVGRDLWYKMNSPEDADKYNRIVQEMKALKGIADQDKNYNVNDTIADAWYKAHDNDLNRYDSLKATKSDVDKIIKDMTPETAKEDIKAIRDILNGDDSRDILNK